MKNFCLAALAASLLSGCAGGTTATGTSTVAGLEAAYLAAAAAAVAYEAMPNANPAVVAVIKRDENTVFSAMQPLVTAAQAGGSVDAVALAAAQAAITALQADLPATAAAAAPAAAASTSAPGATK